MCCFCHCFAWSFDLLQRFLAFILTCCLCVAICFGLTLALVVGVAYGYHYSIAEFLTFTRSDITVYMRRGQFYDKPELNLLSRRKGDFDIFASNASTDYEDPKIIEGDAKPLADSWVKAQDTRNYAEKLTKYASSKNVIRKYNVEDDKAQVHPSYQNDRMQPASTQSTTVHQPTLQRSTEEFKKLKFWHSDPVQNSQRITDSPVVHSTFDPDTEEHLLYRATKKPGGSKSNKAQPWRTTSAMDQFIPHDPENPEYDNIMYNPV